MTAIVQDGHEAPERVLRPPEIDVPPAGDGEVLIRVRATRVTTPTWIGGNRPDPGSAMTAIVQDGHEAPERVLRPPEIDVPPAGDGEVLIRVRATRVTTPTWIAVTGVLAILRLSPGLRRLATAVRHADVAGIVESGVPTVTDLLPATVVIDKVFPLGSAAQAVAHMLGHRASGKVVIAV